MSTNVPITQQQPIWTPSPYKAERSNLAEFISFIRGSGRFGAAACEIDGFRALKSFSVRHPAEFWKAVWEYTGVISSRQPEETASGLDRMQPPGDDGPKWFTGARLNFAENLLRFRDNSPAIISWNEGGFRETVTFNELYRSVAALSAAMRAAGVGVGDRVAGLMPNIPETVIAMLAAASIGGIWSSTSPEFGVQAVIDRFGQIKPKLLFAPHSYVFAGKSFNICTKVAEIAHAIPEIETVVLVPNLKGWSITPAGSIRNSKTLDQFVSGYERAPEVEFTQLPFDHPLYILYSSGTTGAPKCIVHGAGGTLLQHLKELALHSDVWRGDRVFYYTTCGWMMWNWLVSSLALGAAILLYEGSPFHPRNDALWTMADYERITHFGTSAKYIAMCEKEGLVPSGDFDLSSLRFILSTGSPLAPSSFDYVYSSVKSDVCLSSISGGTDIISCFALGAPTEPVYRGELQTTGLGMKVEVWDENGVSVVGKPGELVCTIPFPSMPVSFWNDPGGEKYRAAYFEHFPGVWRHGDWAEMTERGGVIIYGRSDATLNPGGVRIGTAEIYRQVETIAEVLESVVVGQEWDGDMRIVLFVRIREGFSLTAELKDSIRLRIRENASPHHSPKKIIEVADVPRTMNGKISEIAVREAIHGRDVKNLDALANPEAIELYRNLAELRSP